MRLVKCALLSATVGSLLLGSVVSARGSKRHQASGSKKARLRGQPELVDGNTILSPSSQLLTPPGVMGGYGINQRRLETEAPVEFTWPRAQGEERGDILELAGQSTDGWVPLHMINWAQSSIEEDDDSVGAPAGSHEASSNETLAFQDLRWTSQKGAILVNGHHFHVKGITWYEPHPLHRTPCVSPADN